LCVHIIVAGFYRTEFCVTDMATYFHGSTSEIPSSAEGLQTLYLMNPNYVPYSDAAQHPAQNMLLVNPNNASNTSPTSANALNLGNFTHAPPPPSPNNHRDQHHHHHHLIGLTIPSSNIIGSNTATGDHAHARPSFLGQHEFSGFPGGAAASTTASTSRSNYNLWGSMFDQSGSNMVTATNTPSENMGCVASAVTASTQIGFHRPNHLSLSLSSQQTPYRSLSGDVHAISPASLGGDDMRGLQNGVSSMHSVVLGSKYLKSTQELLDEVVNVGKGISKGEESMEGAKKEKMKGNIESTSGVGDGSSCGGENNDGGKQGGELGTAQRQELQMKKSKLVSMLDEVYDMFV